MLPRLGFLLIAIGCSLPAAQSQVAAVHVALDQPAKPISPDLVGIFFEDLSYAADGGLYAELVQNRSFEYHGSEQPTWNNLTAWELVTRGAGKGSLKIDASFPLHPNNPNYAALAAEVAGGGVGLANAGFDGIPVREGETYDFSAFVRQNHFGRRWADVGKSGVLPFVVRLEQKDGNVLAEAKFDVTAREWTRIESELRPNRSADDARLVVLLEAQGGVALDEVSLFPRKTFRGRKNGLRADLAETIAALKPKFMRFPGGCLVHGNGLGNMYHWKDTIGPIEQRRQQKNIWNYHQSMGLGYFEYFQFCEDIGAKPLPVVPAGVCCQNSGHGIGQAGLPLEQMDDYIQDVLDLIEWANGPADSPWGAKRAAAGHPEPFGLEYVGVGNEDQITPVFRDRFERIYRAVKAKHPEIVVIGTVGPFPDGEDFEAGWKIARELQLPMVDEHYYRPPQWFWDNLARYDTYDRSAAKVYVGEYAAHDERRRSTLRSAIAEAAYLTSLERNADVVTFASYAPLLARRGHTHWAPNLIFFDGTQVFPTLNYTVQQLFSLNSGDASVPTAVEFGGAAPKKVSVSAVRDSRSGELILKVVNGESEPQSLNLVLAGGSPVRGATRTVFAGPNADVVNEDGQSPAVQPLTETVDIAPQFNYESPAHSLTIWRMKSAR